MIPQPNNLLFLIKMKSKNIAIFIESVDSDETI